MPINPNIAMGYKAPEFDSPINQLSQLMQMKQMQQANQLNQMKMDEYGRGIESNNRLQSILRGEYQTPEARQDAILKGGFLKEAQDYGKGNADILKTQSEAKYKEIESAKKRADLAGSVFGYVRQNPTLENAFAAIDNLAANSVYSTEQAAEYKAKVQANPQAIAQMADMAFRGALDAKDQLAKLGDFNAGGSQQFTSTDPVSGKLTMTGAVPITESANNIANNERIAREGRLNRGNSMQIAKMADERGKESNRIAAENRQEKPLTEGQSKSALFGSRMAMANKIFDTLESSGTTTSTPGMNSGYGIGNVVSALSGKDQQQLMQAKRDFLNAVLRRESGAVIGESEFAGGEKQYFPQVGDTKEVIAQKKANREAAMRGVLIDVPSNRRDEIVNEIAGQGASQGGATKGKFKYLGTE